MTETQSTPNIQVGSVQAEHKVVIRLGGMFTTVSPPTARAIAIALIHHAEIAGLPDPAPEPEPRARLWPQCLELCLIGQTAPRNSPEAVTLENRET